MRPPESCMKTGCRQSVPSQEVVTELGVVYEFLRPTAKSHAAQATALRGDLPVDGVDQRCQGVNATWQRAGRECGRETHQFVSMRSMA